MGGERGAGEMSIKVFRINDYDWWAAESLEAAVTAAIAQSGEPEEADDPYELSDDQMEKMIFVRDDGTKVSFAEELKSHIAAVEAGEAENPCLFASTEF